MAEIAKNPNMASDKEWDSSKLENLDRVFVKLKPYLDHPEFTEGSMSKHGAAAAGLCKWVIHTAKVLKLGEILSHAAGSKEAAETALDQLMTAYSYLSDEHWTLSDEVAKLEADIELLKAKQELEAKKGESANPLDEVNVYVDIGGQGTKPKKKVAKTTSLGSQASEEPSSATIA